MLSARKMAIFLQTDSQNATMPNSKISGDHEKCKLTLKFFTTVQNSLQQLPESILN